MGFVADIMTKVSTAFPIILKYSMMLSSVAWTTPTELFSSPNIAENIAIQKQTASLNYPIVVIKFIGNHHIYCTTVKQGLNNTPVSTENKVLS